MTSIIHDFKSIRRKLERQEQKAEYEANNPKEEPSMYGWPYGVAVPLVNSGQSSFFEQMKDAGLAGSLDALYAKTLSNVKPMPLKSKAHPEWPYAGTPFEWSKFVKVKI